MQLLIDVPLIDVVYPCEMSSECLSSPAHKGEGGSLCSSCVWSPNGSGDTRDNFRVPKGSRVKFARKEEADYAERRAKVAAKRTVESAKSKPKARIGRRAALAEKRSERGLIKSTRNSGRTNRDGDHNFADKISLDTKLQTGNLNPVVNLADLAKIQADARRVGNPIGVLVLRNKNNVGVVAISEADWRTILDWLSAG